MATVREGTTSVLLVVDVQVGVVGEAWERPRIVGNVARAVERARQRSVPVLWVQHSDAELVPGSPAWQWVPELFPAVGEPLIHKCFESSFEQTTLEAELARVGATHIALAGASTNWCIRATAYAALERGYDLTLVADAHTTRSMDLEDGGRLEAESMVADLNVVMTWIQYPGRRNGIVRADDLDFATPEGARR